MKGGLSKRISDEEFNGTLNYEIKGPMGKGLDLQRDGVHLAFTAGTGILPFLDLVAFLIRENLGLNESLQSNEQDFLTSSTPN